MIETKSTKTVTLLKTKTKAQGLLTAIGSVFLLRGRGTCSDRTTGDFLTLNIITSTNDCSYGFGHL